MHPFVEGFGLALLLLLWWRMGLRGLWFAAVLTGCLAVEYWRYSGVEDLPSKILVFGALGCAAVMASLAMWKGDGSSVAAQTDRVDPSDF